MVESWSGSGWNLTKDLRFVYDGWQMIAELDHTFATGTGLAGSAVNRTFLWGPDLSGTMTGADGVGGLLSTTYQSITYEACSDANGNVTGLVPVSGMDAGTLTARYDYDPFGNRVSNEGPSVELCPLGFSSKYLDMESGIVSYELRGYLPGMGRWPSRDPIGERGGINLYGMVGNDAVNRRDCLGLYAEAGHYYTAYLVAKAAGRPDEEAMYLAFHVQLPDEHRALTAFEVDFKLVRDLLARDPDFRDIQATLHALQGAGVTRYRKCILGKITQGTRPLWQRGILVHTLGDSHSHTYHSGRPFPTTKLRDVDSDGSLPDQAHGAPPAPSPTVSDYLGHFGHGIAPDLIGRRPRLYRLYAQSLFEAFGGSGSLFLTAAGKEMDDVIKNLPTSGSHRAEAEAFSNLAVDHGYNIANYRPERYGAVYKFSVEGVKKLMQEVKCDCLRSKSSK